MRTLFSREFRQPWNLFAKILLLLVQISKNKQWRNGLFSGVDWCVLLFQWFLLQTARPTRVGALGMWHLPTRKMLKRPCHPWQGNVARYGLSWTHTKAVIIKEQKSESFFPANRPGGFGRKMFVSPSIKWLIQDNNAFLISCCILPLHNLLSWKFFSCGCWQLNSTFCNVIFRNNKEIF